MAKLSKSELKYLIPKLEKDIKLLNQTLEFYKHEIAKKDVKN